MRQVGHGPHSVAMVLTQALWSSSLLRIGVKTGNVDDTGWGRTTVPLTHLPVAYQYYPRGYSWGNCSWEGKVKCVGESVECASNR
jgi:hypothetical protein